MLCLRGPLIPCGALNEVHWQSALWSKCGHTAKINVYRGDEGLVFSSGEESFLYSHSSSYMTNIQNTRSECNTYYKKRIHTQSVLISWNKSAKKFKLLHNITQVSCRCEIPCPRHSAISKAISYIHFRKGIDILL